MQFSVENPSTAVLIAIKPPAYVTGAIELPDKSDTAAAYTVAPNFKSLP